MGWEVGVVQEMAIFVPWLADAARLTGYPVVEEAGWRTRGVNGYGMTRVEGIVGHHTAGPATGEYPCRNIILNGHSTLSGPLANYGLGRSGTIYVVAAGRANHAGTSSWAGYTNLNDDFLGIEAEDDGDGNWTQAQLDCYPRLVAAALHYMRRSVDRYAGHKDIAPTRKVDPAGIASDWMRNQAGIYLKNPPSINKGYLAGPAPGEEDEMQFRSIHDVNTGRIGLVAPKYFRTLNGPQWEAAKAAGICDATPDSINSAEWDIVKETVLNSE